MAELYLSLFIFICFSIVGWSIIRLERVYQFPFFMAAIFISFILPQAKSLVDSRSLFISDSALERVLFYSSLCIAMCWIGYQFKPNSQWLNKLNAPIDKKKLFKAGIVLMVFGRLCYFLLSIIEIQKTAAGTWTGPATILIFFGNVLYIAVPIFLLDALKKPNYQNITFFLISVWPFLESILDGRRQPTMAILITIGLCFFIVKNYVPPRILMIILVVTAAYIIPTLGLLREKFWELVFVGDWQGILDASKDGLNKVSEGTVLELRNATLMMDSAVQLNLYGYGGGFWDSFIFNYVPGQIVGFDLKKSFQLNITSYDLNEMYGYTIPLGSTPTGIGDSFINFGYFGCLIFALMAILFKNLWTSLTVSNSIVSTLLYISLITPAMIGVTHGIGAFINQFIFNAGISFFVFYYSRSEIKQKNIWLKPILKQEKLK